VAIATARESGIRMPMLGIGEPGGGRPCG
jgi:hypothetical protein